VGGAAAVLAARRLLALAALAAALAAYYAWHESLPNLTLWWDIALLAFVVMPAVFATVWLLLPLWSARGVWLVGVAFVPLAAVLDAAGADGAASFAKLGAATFFAWWFLSLFEDVSWVVLVGAIVPWVDAYSVFRGPTRAIVTHRRGIFDHLSFAFPVPGQASTANLGIPALVFFALFLAAAARWRLRPVLTWVLLVASFGATTALAVWLDVAGLHGLPALPLLSLAFFVANGDVLWRRLRARRS
jgi:hypothetical protein